MRLDSHPGPASDPEMGSEKHASSGGATRLLPTTGLPAVSGPVSVRNSICAVELLLSKLPLRTGETAQWPRAQSLLTEDLSVSLSVRQHKNACSSNSRGASVLFWLLWHTPTLARAHTHMYVLLSKGNNYFYVPYAGRI